MRLFGAICGICSTIMVLFGATVTVAQSNRALIIGNGAYESVPPLVTSQPDARALKRSLVAMGFETTLLVDADWRQMASAIDQTASETQSGDLVVVFYSGHGWEDKGTSYILPVDARAGASLRDFRRGSLDVTRDVLEPLTAKNPLAVFAIFDMCRDNPFVANATHRDPLLSDLPTNVVVLHSAEAGACAYDALPDEKPGDDHTVFFRQFLPELKVGVPLQRLARQVRLATIEAASAAGIDQKPVVFSTTVVDVCFAGPCKGISKATNSKVPKASNAAGGGQVSR